MCSCVRVCACLCTYICINQFVFFLHTLHYFGVGVVASVCAFGACKFTAFLCIVIAVSRQREVEGLWCIQCLGWANNGTPTRPQTAAGSQSVCVIACVCVPFSWAWHSARDQ